MPVSTGTVPRAGRPGRYTAGPRLRRWPARFFSSGASTANKMTKNNASMGVHSSSVNALAQALRKACGGWLQAAGRPALT